MYIWLASPKPSELFCPGGHPFLSSFALLFRSFRCDYRNHSANVSCPTFPRPYTTTYLSRMLLCHSNNPHPVGLQIRKLPTSDCCTRDPLSCRLFPLAPRFGLFRCRFSSATRLPQCYNMSAYLPGLHSARPSAFVEGAGFGPAAHPRLFGESP